LNRIIEPGLEIRGNRSNENRLISFRAFRSPCHSNSARGYRGSILRSNVQRRVDANSIEQNANDACHFKVTSGLNTRPAVN